jgi:hypothetical protein
VILTPFSTRFTINSSSYPILHIWRIQQNARYSRSI